MKLRKRLIYYIVGFVLGLILTIVIFADKDILGFLPNNRVLKDIQNSNIMISPIERERLECMGVDENFIFEMIENADVNFSNSQTSYSDEKFVINGIEKTIEVKKYELEYEGKLLSFWIANKDSLSILHTLDNTSCKVSTKESKNLEILYMPEALVFSKMKEKELWLNQEIECALVCHNISKSDVEQLFEDGKILFDESLPSRKPNPIYFIQKNINGSEWIFWVEIGDTKTRIKYVADITGLSIDKDHYLINELFSKAKESDVCNCY